jgi:hypothetical protein
MKILADNRCWCESLVSHVQKKIILNAVGEMLATSAAEGKAKA